jgi:hypothetical protein
MTLFLPVFLAVLSAILIADGVRDFKSSRARHRKYCRQQINEYNRLMAEASNAADKETARLYATQFNYWTKQSKSWIGLRSEDDV